jgi:predicted nucleotide-binding protein (sugar kinase/HSP70/actin superfamily)
MIIERTSKEIIIRLSPSINTDGLQDFLNYLIYQEATEKSKAKQSDVNTLVKKIKKGWWKKNRKRFIK